MLQKRSIVRFWVSLLAGLALTVGSASPSAVQSPPSGPEPPQTIRFVALGDMGTGGQSQYSIAERMTAYHDERAYLPWTWRIRHLTEPHLELGIIMNNLGRLLYDQKKFAESEKLYKLSLEPVQRAGGPEHSKMATPPSNLARLYLDQGKKDLARRQYEDAIVILEKALRPNHPKLVKARTHQ